MLLMFVVGMGNLCGCWCLRHFAVEKNLPSRWCLSAPLGATLLAWTALMVLA